MVKESKETEQGVSAEQVKNLLAEIQAMREQNQMLLEIADKRQLSSWQAKHKSKLPVHIHIREIDGKVVVGWRMTEDYVGKNPLTGVWTENQQTEIVFEDGTTQKMFITEFESKKKLIKCKRVGQSVDEETEQVAYKLVREDNGREYLISSQFVN